MNWGCFYKFGFCLVVSISFSGLVSSPTFAANDCSKNLSSLKHTQKVLNEVREERKRLYLEFLAPGKLLSSNAFRTIVKRNSLDPHAVVQDLFNSFQIEFFPVDGTAENRQKNLTQIKNAEAKAKELGITLEAFLELSDVVRQLKSNPRKEKEFQELISNVLPEYGMAIKNRNAEMPEELGTRRFHSASRNADGGGPFMAVTTVFGGIGSVVGIVSAAVGAEKGDISPITAWAMGIGIPALSFGFTSLAIEGYRQWKLLDWRFQRLGGWLQESRFRSNWKKSAKAKMVSGKAAEEQQELTPVRDVDITSPYAKVSQTDVPGMKFEGLTNEVIFKFAEPLQSATHQLLEQTAARVADLSFASRGEQFDQLSQEIQKRHKTKGISKLEAGKLVTSLLESVQEKSRQHQSSLLSMRADAKALDANLKAAVTEIENLQIGISDRLSQEISPIERSDWEETMMVLERRKENLVGDLVTVQNTAFHIGKAIDTLGNQEQGLRRTHQLLHLAGDGFETALNASAMDNLIKNLAVAKAGVAPAQTIPKLVVEQSFSSQEQSVSPSQVQVRERR